MMRRQRWLQLAFAAGIIAVAIPVVARFLARNRRRFTYAVGTMSPEVYSGLTAGKGWEAVQTTVAPGISLNGILRQPKSPNAPWILFFPGNDGTQLATAQKFLENVRAQNDWGLAVWAYRGFASSGGVPERDVLAGDAIEIFTDLLARENLDPSRVHVVAFSLGGYLATNVVGVEMKAGRKPASLSLLASVEDIAMIRASWAQRLVIGDVYEIEPLLDAISPPVLVVQGTEDEALGVEQGRKIAARLGSRAHYLELQGVGHNVLLDTDSVFRAVRAMVEPSAPRVLPE